MSSSGTEKTGQDGESVSACAGTGAEGYFASDYRFTERTLGVVIGGRHAWAHEECGKLFGKPLGREKFVAKIDGLWM